MLLCLVLHFFVVMLSVIILNVVMLRVVGQQKDKESMTAVDVYALLMSKQLQWKSPFGVNYRHEWHHDTHHNEHSA